MQSTVAAKILAFVYRCGGSDGLTLLIARTVFPFHSNNGAVIGTPANIRYPRGTARTGWWNWGGMSNENSLAGP